MTSENDKERRNDRPSVPEMLAHAVIKLCGTPANILARWGSLAFIAWVLAQPTSDAIVALSGKTTLADIHITANANAEVTTKSDININGNAAAASNNTDNEKQTISQSQFNYLYLAVFGILFGIGSLIIANRQRRLRSDVIETKSERIRVLERVVDSDRTTSGLTRRGETHPEDE